MLWAMLWACYGPAMCLSWGCYGAAMGLLWGCFGPVMPVVRVSMLVGMGSGYGQPCWLFGSGYGAVNGLCSLLWGRYGAVCRGYVGCMGLRGAVWGCLGLFRAVWGCMGLYTWGCIGAGMGLPFELLWVSMLLGMVLYVGGKVSHDGGLGALMGLSWGCHGPHRAFMGLSWGFNEALVGFSWGSHGAAMGLSCGSR